MLPKLNPKTLEDCYSHHKSILMLEDDFLFDPDKAIHLRDKIERLVSDLSITSNIWPNLPGLNSPEWLHDSISYAFLLNQLAERLVPDISKFEDMYDLWNNKVSKTKRGVFVEAKNTAVTKAARRIFDAINGDLRELNSFKGELSYNINMAAFFDLLRGNLANYMTGINLSYWPYEGDIEIRDRSLVLKHKDSEFYRDLYIAWNLTFITTIPNIPHSYYVLVIPSVLEGPADTFIGKRVLVLYMHHRWLLLRNIDKYSSLDLRAKSDTKKLGKDLRRIYLKAK